MEKHQFLNAKNRIGQGSKLNYGSNSTVFRREDCDERVISRKDEVVTFAKGERFLNNKSWDQSNHLNKPVYESKKMENFVHDRSNPYQYNFRAESLGPSLQAPEEKPHKFKVTMKNTGAASLQHKATLYDPQCPTLKRNQEMPVHAKLQEPFHREWNCSSEVIRKDLNKTGDSLTQSAKMNSEKKKKLINTTKYQNPAKLSAKLGLEVRRQKETGNFSVKKPVFQVTEEQVNRTELVNRYAVEPDLTFTTTKHSGVWEKQADGRFMWSDTGSYVFDSPGDIVIKHNPDHYNYAKPNLSQSRSVKK
jgi:hypothetical protein